MGRAPCDAPGQALSADDEENLARVAPPPFDDAPSADAPAEGWDDAEPPFDPPDLAEALGPAEGEREDEDPPFDPPDPGDEIFVCAEQKTSEPKIGQAAATSPSPPRAKPVPTISIHVSWEQSSTGDIIDAFAADPLLARAKIAVGRGGIDAAIERLSGGERPDLLIIDTNLQRGEMLAGLDRLVEVSHRDLKLIIIGSINDVGLLRDLNARGVSQYLMSTPAPDDLASMVANLYVDTDKSHLLAVIGARGGVGASTIAANIAFAVAGGRNLTAALLDLDLCFGASAFNFSADAAGALSEVLAANGEVDEDIALDRIAMRPMERLKVFTAPATPGRSASLDCASLERLVRGARRTSQFVVVDLPHLWSPWVKQALRLADDILIVAGPDLASLRNTSNMLKALRELRAGAPEPMIALSTVGAPKRPEIPLRDFAQACGVTPCASFGFDPALFGSCEMASQMLVHAAPQSKAAKAIEMLATMVTGAEASVAKASPVPETARPDVIEARAVPVATEEAKTEEQPPLELVDEAPSVDYITRARLLAEAQATVRPFGAAGRAQLAHPGARRLALRWVFSRAASGRSTTEAAARRVRRH
ncbi:MAG: hypothetical protein R3C25_02215 [Hyphomonadaceae bacterium]